MVLNLFSHCLLFTFLSSSLPLLCSGFPIPCSFIDAFFLPPLPAVWQDTFHLKHAHASSVGCLSSKEGSPYCLPHIGHKELSSKHRDHYLGCFWYPPLGLLHHQIHSHFPWSLGSCKELGQLALSIFFHSPLLIPSLSAFARVLLDDNVSVKLWHVDQCHSQHAFLLGLSVSAQLQCIDFHLLWWHHRWNWQSNLSRPWSFNCSHCLRCNRHPLFSITVSVLTCLACPSQLGSSE